VQNIEGEVFFLAQSGASSFYIAKLQNRQVVPVSTPGVDRILDDFSGSCASWAFKDMGHTFYGFTSFSLNVTLVYDVRESVWYLWMDQNGNYWPWGACAKALSSTVTVQSLVPGNLQTQVFEVDEEYYNDNGTLFNVDIYTPNYDSGSRRKDALKRMDFIADQQPGILQVRHNDNDFAPGKWSNFRNVDLNQKRPTLTSCGSFRRRSWHFRWYENYPLRLEAVELDILPGTA
jgi:hypothetical protein